MNKSHYFGTTSLCNEVY